MSNVIIQRPWGWSSTLQETRDATVHEITLRSEQSTEVVRRPQHHTTWVVISGSCSLEVEGTLVDLSQYENYLVPAGLWYKISNRDDGMCKLIEIVHNERP